MYLSSLDIVLALNTCSHYLVSSHRISMRISNLLTTVNNRRSQITNPTLHLNTDFLHASVHCLDSQPVKHGSFIIF